MNSGDYLPEEELNTIVKMLLNIYEKTDDLSNLKSINTKIADQYQSRLQAFREEANQWQRKEISLENQLRENNQLQKQREEDVLTLARRDKLTYFLISLISTLGIVTFIQLRNARKKRLLVSTIEEQNLELTSINTELNQQKDIIENQHKKLTELDEAKTQLYTNITHEFRTPLTMIKGSTEQITGYDKQKNIISRNVDQILNHINQILELKKLEAGELSVHFIQYDVILFLKYIFDSFESYAQNKNISCHFSSNPDQMVMDFDQLKLTSIITNLMSNAVKFTDEGGDIYMEIKKLSNDRGGEIEVIVKDTGIGLSPEDAEKIFNQYYQADQSELTTTIGTGIGLSLARQLSKLLGGSLNATGIKGQGSKFILRLPITNNATHKESVIQKQIVVQEEIFDVPINIQDPTRKTILLVEDNRGIVNYIHSILAKSYNIKIALNGEEGIKLAIEQTPDLIISDVMMPIKNGFELCRTLKSDIRSSHIPIILLTAKGDKEDRLIGLDHGADAFLTKPFIEKELLIRIDNLLELRQTLQQKYAQWQPDNIHSNTQNREIEFLNSIHELVVEQLDNADFDQYSLCKSLSISKSQLYRKLKALTDESPAIYIRSIRLQKAKSLLLDSNLNVSEIAYATGFNTPQYFTKCFLQEFGNRPTDIRYQAHTKIE